MVVKGDLFNPKTIERLCVDVKLSSKQKQSAKEWLQLLEDNKLEDEKSNYPKFMQIILQDILGYPIKEIDYESENVEFQFGTSEGNNILCFEAKGTATKDLFAPQHRTKKEHETPIKQTWDYMGSIGLDYGICTNYKEFVLITKELGYSKYYLFDFNSIKKNDEKLKEFVGIFSKERIIEKGFVEKLHQESLIEEREFTKEFYKLFHETRLMMIKAFQEKEDVTKDDAIHFTQLYLNRLIFMFFAEDHDFLEDKLFTKRVTEVVNSTLISEHSKLVSDEILGLFKAMDEGSHRLGIFGFNGGLFKEHIPPKIYFSDLKDAKFFSDVRQNSKLKIKPDETTEKIIKKYQNELNPIIINLLMMDSFDFTSEINVNILGHIFEQSISDLEELKEEGISRRKKEGVYYTPEYITDYICRNTIIPYLSKSGVNSIHELITEYKDNVEELEKKFKEIKILDPACGSGAFLVKAVDILLEIHKEIQIIKELRGKYATGNQFQLTKWNEETEARMFVENNIYGVDINSESVEITKLSLFLKIASKHRKLIGLEKNIKVGNSIIDDKTVDARAFDWNKEFPEVLNQLIKDKGFDIVIGNPPYVRQELFKEIKSHLKTKYTSYDSLSDLYVYFLEKGIRLLKENGIMSFILPNKFLKTEYGKEIRDYLKNSCEIKKIYDFDDYPVFADATTYPIILVLTNKITTNNSTLIYSRLVNKKSLNPIDSMSKTEQKIPHSMLDSSSWIFANSGISKIIQKMNGNSISLKDFVSDKIFRGISTGKNDVFIIDKTKFDELSKDPKSKFVLKQIVTGSEVKRYDIDFQNQYILFIPWDYDLDQSQTIKEYLLSNKKELEQRPEVKEGKFNWWCLSRYGSKNAIYLSEPKIIYPRITNQSNFSLDVSGEMYLSDNNFFISTGSKSLLAVLNSSLFFFYLKQICPTLRGGFYDFRRPYVETIPIHKNISKYEKELSTFANDLLNFNKLKSDEETKFWNRINHEFNIEKINKKLENFSNQTFNEFLKELQKITSAKLSLTKQDEWEEYFNEKKRVVQELEKEINQSDDKINKIVYDMYNLTDGDINIIEKNIVSE